LLIYLPRAEEKLFYGEKVAGESCMRTRQGTSSYSDGMNEYTKWKLTVTFLVVPEVNSATELIVKKGHSVSSLQGDENRIKGE